jgi:hypothetical protein
VTALDLASNESLPSNEIHFVGLWHPSGGEAGEIAGIPASNRIGLSASPNPFNNYTNLKISLPKAGNVEVKIYDIAGKEVASLYQGYYSTGIFELHWNASDLPSGVYFARLTAGGFTQTQKILLMK